MIQQSGCVARNPSFKWNARRTPWLAYRFAQGFALCFALGFSLAAASAQETAAPSAKLPYQFDADVMVEMRDGVKLATHVYRPRGEGKFPTILMRTPYGKSGGEWDEADKYTSAGYVMVTQDCRGRGQSAGVWDPFRYDPEDGFDTQQWIGRQSWSNGEIGTAGGSYLGWTQWASAPLASPNLKTMVPIVPFGDPYDEVSYPGGAFQLALGFG